MELESPRESLGMSAFQILTRVTGSEGLDLFPGSHALKHEH